LASGTAFITVSRDVSAELVTMSATSISPFNLGNVIIAVGLSLLVPLLSGVGWGVLRCSPESLTYSRTV
jgi:hypothetical protein